MCYKHPAVSGTYIGPPGSLAPWLTLRPCCCSLPSSSPSQLVINPSFSHLDDLVPAQSYFCLPYVTLPSLLCLPKAQELPESLMGVAYPALFCYKHAGHHLPLPSPRHPPQQPPWSLVWQRKPLSRQVAPGVPGRVGPLPPVQAQAAQALGLLPWASSGHTWADRWWLNMWSSSRNRGAGEGYDTHCRVAGTLLK